MQISPHFTLDQLTFSETAIRKGIDNTPDDAAIENMKILAEKILEPLLFALPQLHINSCFRCVRLNSAIGGAKNSQHTLGQAVDVTVPEYNVQELFLLIINRFKFDQCIQEFSSWVHISFAPILRNEKLLATKANGKTIYTKIAWTQKM